MGWEEGTDTTGRVNGGTGSNKIGPKILIIEVGKAGRCAYKQVHSTILF